MVRILDNLFDLKETRFGQPHPRHGLNLLWWFAHDCVQIDSNGHMTAKCNPANGAFGFHQFFNKERLLPKIDLPYYEVGNLHNPGSLPHYVTRSYTGQSDNSNKDRIIVSFDSRWKRFKKIYVTQHSDQVRFDQNHTYCISIDLLRIIQGLSHNDFLREPTSGSGRVSISIPQSVQTKTFQSRPASNELMKNFQELSRIHFHREPTNGSESVSISIPQSVRTNTFQSRLTSNELMKNFQELSHIDLHREPTDGSGRVSISIPQSVQDNQTNTDQSEKCWSVLICCVVLMLLAAAVYFLFKII